MPDDFPIQGASFRCLLECHRRLRLYTYLTHVERATECEVLAQQRHRGLSLSEWIRGAVILALIRR